MKRLSLLVALVLAGTGLTAGPGSAARSGATSVMRLPALDTKILSLLNETRASHGLKPLALSDELTSAASAHSRAMLEGGFFAHDSRDGTSFVDRLKRYYGSAGFDSWSAGENLLYNTAAIEADEAISAWIESPAHRENMLDPGWREVGIASLQADAAGGTFGGEPTWVITVDFGTRTLSSKGAKPAAGRAMKAADRQKASRPQLRPSPKPKRKKPEKHQVVRVLPVPVNERWYDGAPGDATADEVAGLPVDGGGEQGDDELVTIFGHQEDDAGPGGGNDEPGAGEPPPPTVP